MKNKINIQDFLTFIYWVKTFSVMEGKKFKYGLLLEQAETYLLNNTPLDTNIHNIDELVIEAYHIYERLQNTKEKVKEIIEKVNFPYISKEMILQEAEKYEKIFEDLLENYKYEDPEILGIQKGFLIERMKKCIEIEDYENAARIRDLIKNYN